MNWIAAWLKARCEYRDKTQCIDCARMCAAKERLAEGTGCSFALIEILIAGGITHPKIADDIAAFTGATMQQRDKIVHRIHRGKIQKQIKSAERRKRPKQERQMRKVVALDRLGNEIARFASVIEAGKRMGVSETPVRDRCNGRFPTDKDEFKSFGMTFRYAVDWDCLSRQEKMENIHRCRTG